MAYVGALVTKTGATTANFTGAGATLAWDSETHDTGGWHDNAVNNTRLTVPSGYNISRVNLYEKIVQSAITSANAQYALVRFRKNGSETFTGAIQHANYQGLATLTAWEYFNVCFSVPAVATDYFEAQFLSGSDNSVTVGAASTFHVEASHFDGVA
jgi:hypothetical protein